MKATSTEEMNQLLRACITPDIAYLSVIHFNFEKCAQLARETLGLTDPLQIVDFVQARFRDVCEKVSSLKQDDTLICGHGNDMIVEFTPLKVYDAHFFAAPNIYGRCIVQAFQKEQGTQLVENLVRANFPNLAIFAAIKVEMEEVSAVPGAYFCEELE